MFLIWVIVIGDIVIWRECLNIECCNLLFVINKLLILLFLVNEKDEVNNIFVCLLL